MLIRSRALAADGVAHAFFTREGGVSEGPFAGLNVGQRSGDEPARVARNRALAAGALGVPEGRLVTARQVHGTSCLRVSEPWPVAAPPDADALVTREPDLAIGVLGADCAPILLVDPAAGVAGAAHAGWKGALDGVVDSVVAAMLAAGARAEDTRAAVGPCIGRRSYEVGGEFEERFLARDPASAAFFAPGDSRPRFDLEGYVAMRLRRAGVGRIETLGCDTFTDEQRFFSYRRTRLAGESRFGLQLSAIALRG